MFSLSFTLPWIIFNFFNMYFDYFLKAIKIHEKQQKIINFILYAGVAVTGIGALKLLQIEYLKPNRNIF